VKSTLTIEPVSPFVKRNFLLAQATHGSNKSYVPVQRSVVEIFRRYR
jgi:hypothetical protein